MAYSGARMVQASIMGTCVFVAVAVGVLVAPGTLAPKPLEEAAPALASALRDSVDNLSALLDRTSSDLDEATGEGTPDADESSAPGAQAYASTRLADDDGSVVSARDRATACRALVDDAETVLDPEKTKVGMSDQADPEARPQVIARDQVSGLPAILDSCADQVTAAVTAMDDVLRTAKTTAADQAAAAGNQAVRDSLRDSIAAAQETLDESTAMEAADARTALSVQIDQATALVGADPPTGWQAIDQQTVGLSQAAQKLADAVTALKAVHVYTGGNGDLNPATLCSVPYDTKQLLRCDAEAAWMRLNAEYKSVWGEDIPIDLSYRTYDEQVEARAEYGSGAAVPGTSNHGWGLAVDLPDYRETQEGLEWNYGTPKYEWMKANAPAYGWVNPSWAVEGGVGPHEPWHFEYVG